MTLRVKCALSLLAFALVASAQSTGQPTFSTPEAAAKALVKAVQEGKKESVLAIVGPEMKGLMDDADEDLLKLERELFLSAAKNRVKIENDESDPNRAIAYFGQQEWPFPAPIVKRGAAWQFDGKAGAEEVADRILGRDELAAVAVCNGYWEAQLEYASTDWDDDGILEFAQKLQSSPGKRDGLYWSNDEGGPMSPIGPFLTSAVLSSEGKPQPLAGYNFKMLYKQGSGARGGARNYIVDNNQVFGFALVAWPAEYGKSGVSTFLINQIGDVYEKDLGAQTESIVKSMDAYNPDGSWKIVDQD